MKTVVKKGIINILAAGGANLFTDSVTGASMIVADNTANPLVPIIPIEIRAKSIKNIVYIASAEEVKRFWAIGLAADEVIVASRKYSIDIDYAQYKTESTRRGSEYKYGYTAPAALSGNAATDRFNVYTALNAKINAHTGNFVTSYLVHKIAFTAGTSVGDVTETLVVGETATQATSNVTAKVAKIEITSGTMADDNAAGTIWLYNVSDITAWLSASKAITFGTSTSVTITAAAALTQGVGMVIEDDANYFISADGRGGASVVTLTGGFALATAEIFRDFTYAQGQGDVMLAQKPVYNYKSDDIISGDIDMTFNADPVSIRSYTLGIIYVVDAPEPVAGFNTNPIYAKEIHLYMDESNSTNLTNLKNALNALIGL